MLVEQNTWFFRTGDEEESVWCVPSAKLQATTQFARLLPQYTATYATHMIPARPKASTNLCDPQDCFRTHQALKPTPPRLALVECIDTFKYSALCPSFRLTPSPQHVTSVNFVSSPRASTILRPIKRVRIHLLRAKCWYNKRMNPNNWKAQSYRAGGDLE